MTAWYAGLITLLGAIAIALAAWLVASRQTPSAPVDQVQPRVYLVRRWYFLGLTLLIIVLLALTLRRLPYAAAATTGVATVRVEGRTWAWRIEAAGADSVAGPLRLPSGQPVVFDVTSGDVNHGFAIYTPEGTLLAQVQAMPGYHNRLSVVFPRPGTYTVLCLEYCGIAHHAMLSSIEVE